MLEKNVKLVRPNMYKSVTTFSEETLKGSKATRAETVYTSTVTYNDMKFDADEKSMDRMARYLNVASYEFNATVSSGITVADAFASAYTNTTVEWKLADNSTVTISIQNLAEIYKLAVINMKEIWLLN